MSDVNTLLFLTTSAVMVFPGRRFFKTAWTLARHFSADMNTLVAVGTGSAYIFSSMVVLFPRWLPEAAAQNTLYFDTSATIITLILMGRLLEARAKRKTTDAITGLMHVQPKTARILRDGIETDVPISSLTDNVTVIVRPGKLFPLTASSPTAPQQSTSRC